jgi:integrase
MLGLEVLRAQVRALRAISARFEGETVETPPLIVPCETGAVPGGTLSEALSGWQKERTPSQGVLAEYQRAIRLFSELHGDLPIVQIKRSHARKFCEELQDVPRHCPGELMRLPLPALAEWGRAHPKAKKISPQTVNKLFGGVQTLALWAFRNGSIPDDVPWSDPFANMRLSAPASNRDVFTVDEINRLFASPIFTKMERPEAGRGAAAFWLPLLSLYSGARRSELTQLTVSDVTKVADVVCFRFVEDTVRGKKLKTETSARTVPVHLELIKLG